jgi:enterochelin esterase-like enzyme
MPSHRLRDLPTWRAQPVSSAKWVGVWLALTWAASAAAGPLHHAIDLDQLNASLHGYVVDYTHNHGADRRIWSAALCEKRDLYVYLPPGFDPSLHYPLVIYLHGLTEDEHGFIKNIVPLFDRAIACGEIPPLILAAADGSISGKEGYLQPGSFYINTKAGNFEDYVMQDVWNFLFCNFPLRPEREAHVLMGASMGGFAAYNLGIKYRDRVKLVAGMFPSVNLRYVDCHGNYHAPFDPCCWGWRTRLPPHEVLARFYCVIPVRMKRLTRPLYGWGHRQQTLAEISRENPVEMLDTYDVQPGDLDMIIGWGGKDQFNIGAQVESFLYVAHCRGLEVETAFLPEGKHDLATGVRLFPQAAHWLAVRLAPFCPGYVCPPAETVLPEPRIDKAPAPAKP